jgi:hypothetical protein
VDGKFSTEVCLRNVAGHMDVTKQRIVTEREVRGYVETSGKFIRKMGNDDSNFFGNFNRMNWLRK